MNKIVTSAMLLSALALTACASVEPAPATETASAAKPSGNSEAPITGSRIPSKTTEKMVGQIGGADYAADKRAVAEPLKVH